MSGLYIHIPFCKQKCHYCDFHFAVSHRQLSDMVKAIKQELILRKDEIPEPLETIYLGGGTPSLLSYEQLSDIFKTLDKSYDIVPNAEITLEANPDNLSKDYLKHLSRLPINRLSIGVQSFKQEDLLWMNRAHTANEALQSIKTAQDYGFYNLTIDLIYGLPEASTEGWYQNLEAFFELDIQHLSAYALTVEAQTALSHFINKGLVKPVIDDKALSDYQYLINIMKIKGFEHYEISNFAKPNHYAIHNTAYWQGKSYLGIGPSAHSYIGQERLWNIAHNSKYIKSINKGVLPLEKEQLTLTDRYNEYLMTGLRTQWGIDLSIIKEQFGEKYYNHIKQIIDSKKHLDYWMFGDFLLKLTEKGLFFADGIISDLFYED